jgi:ketosteroid isomerase-like protein
VSKENVDLHRRIYDALNAGDAEALVPICDRNVEVQSAFAAVGGAVYHGHDGARKWQADLEEAWGGEFRVELEAYFDLGDRTVVIGALYGRGEQSGAEVAMPASAIAEWRNGLCTSHKAYPRQEAVFEELGISADQLEPIAP